MGRSDFVASEKRNGSEVGGVSGQWAPSGWAGRGVFQDLQRKL